MVHYQLAQQFLARGRQKNQDLAAIFCAPLAAHHSRRFQAVNQFDCAVMLNLQLFGQVANSRSSIGRQTFQGKQQLILAGLEI